MAGVTPCDLLTVVLWPPHMYCVWLMLLSHTTNQQNSFSIFKKTKWTGCKSISRKLYFCHSLELFQAQQMQGCIWLRKASTVLLFFRCCFLSAYIASSLPTWQVRAPTTVRFFKLQNYVPCVLISFLLPWGEIIQESHGTLWSISLPQNKSNTEWNYKAGSDSPYAHFSMSDMQ